MPAGDPDDSQGIDDVLQLLPEAVRTAVLAHLTSQAEEKEQGASHLSYRDSRQGFVA